MIHSLVVALLLLPASRSNSACICPAVPAHEQTRWGNEHITISTVTRVRVLKGTISDSNDSPMPNALIEVFTDPGQVTLPYSPAVEARRARQRRIAACFTDAAGKFCIPRLPPGSYELRSSAQGFQAVSQTIKVIAKGRARKHVSVRLPVAT